MRVLEPDDGSGWVKVSDYQGHDGLVPASDLEYEDAVAKPVQGSGQYGGQKTCIDQELIPSTSTCILLRIQHSGIR